MGNSTILDRLEEVGKIDKSDMLGHCMKTPKYCKDAIQRAKQIRIPKVVNVSEKISIKYGKPKHVLIAGMGGSAIGGEILRDWLRYELPIPIEVCKNYVLPAYANEDTLVFAISHSGNTEETLNAFMDAIHRKCMTITITSGGHLLSFSEKLQIPHVTTLSGFPPRAAIPYLFFPLPILMQRIGVLSNIEGEVKEAIQVLERVSEENSPQTLTKDNQSKRLALELMGTIPVVYGFRQYGAIAHRWKTQFNENSKVPSGYAVFPELNHNEVVGWEALEALTKKFSIILIRDHEEPPEIKNRIEVTKLMALHKAQKVLEIYASGRGRLAKMFSVLHVGNFVSIYLAVLRNVDPTLAESIDKIKMEMGKRFNMIERLTQSLKSLERN